MKYMLLVCGDDTADATKMAPVGPWVEELGGRGVRLHGNRLRPPADAVTVRVREGEVLRTDGPFAETKEYVAGYDVLECDSLEEAVAAAARHPVATIGAMEVRPFWHQEDAREPLRLLDAELTRAARERDVEAALACYATDVEVVSPVGLTVRGTAALRKAWAEAYGAVTGPVRREVVESSLHVDESVAFGRALVRTTGTLADGTALDRLLRVSTGYRAVAEQWLIHHEHLSVAAGEEGRS
ncbi:MULTISPECIES: YciI family protein [unclassified Streptomyces]|uniref:YciI family protein n=1 Tax=unclassified Streptomyces TaxID=2593676 RepID=UPI0004BEDD85|nr:MULTISPECIES: YciI family protein [unclassified Streptomyces]